MAAAEVRRDEAAASHRRLHVVRGRALGLQVLRDRGGRRDLDKGVVAAAERRSGCGVVRPHNAVGLLAKEHLLLLVLVLHELELLLGVVVGRDGRHGQCGRRGSKAARMLRLVLGGAELLHAPFDVAHHTRLFAVVVAELVLLLLNVERLLPLLLAVHEDHRALPPLVLRQIVKVQRRHPRPQFALFLLLPRLLHSSNTIVFTTVSCDVSLPSVVQLDLPAVGTGGAGRCRRPPVAARG